MANLNWYDIIVGFAHPTASAVPQVRSTFDVEFALWKNMIEEPSRYGDDIADWLELNDKLSRGSGRWRLGAYWASIEVAQDAAEAELQAPWRNLFTRIAKQAADDCMRRWCERDVANFVARLRNAIVTIQSATRGHQTRSKQPFRDCCMCLSHCISPLETDVGRMCHGCAQQGPYTDETGPLPDPWSEFRAVPCC
jgi:hypothetical protein